MSWCSDGDGWWRDVAAWSGVSDYFARVSGLFA
jgi:hypothetical protein